MDRDQLFVALAALLGVSADACQREAEPSAVPVAAYEVASSSSSAAPTSTPTPTSNPTSMATAPPTPPPAQTSGASCAVRPPPQKLCGNVSCGAPSNTPSVSGVESVIASLRPRFRACYQKEAASDPNLEGSVTLAVEIAANGNVTSVTPGPTKLPASLVSCLAGLVQNAQFPNQSGGAVKLSLPLRFLKKTDAGVP
ncbi:MAG: AgmX/PglI C-terminal domain-containing protein [Polyangiales bacterium]